jgi:hypothetical protein
VLLTLTVAALAELDCFAVVPEGFALALLELPPQPAIATTTAGRARAEPR